MYVIIFDIDTNYLSNKYHNDSLTNPYENIRIFMENNNFFWK